MKDLAQRLITQWEEYLSSNDWGSGEDTIVITQQIEREYYENECYELGLTDDEITKVLEEIGF